MKTLNAFVLALSLDDPRTPQGQPRDPCTLLTAAEVQALAPGVAPPTGVTQVVSGPMGVQRCRYELGSGGTAPAGKYTLTVTLGDAAKTFPGAKQGDIKKALARPRNEGDPPAIMIGKVGQGAYYKSSGTTRAEAVALVNGAVLQVTLEGAGVGSRRNRIIALLKSAAARL